MKSSAATKSLSKPTRARLHAAADDLWRERAGELFVDFERAAKGMLRRAFRGAFGPDEIDDIYSSAWVGTLRTLADRHDRLSNDEIRSYVLTAVANQASKELRRRKRKPIAPLESAPAAVDTGDSPEELAAGAEQSRIAKDLLASLPKRRRAVMLLRYGWGLEPRQVCDLIDGLSPRAYRKEITRGVDELTEKMRRFESGEWCAEREPLLKEYAAGLADPEQVRQARAHIAHCRDCSEFVARLGGHLHDLGAGIATPFALEDLGGKVSVGDRLTELFDHGRDAVGAAVSRGGAQAADQAGPLLGSGGARGAGAASAGVLAKLAGLGAAGKLTVACVGGGVAATACVAAGIGPLGPSGDGARKRGEAAVAAAERVPNEPPTVPSPPPQTLPSQVGHEAPTSAPAVGQEPADHQQEGEDEGPAAPPPEPVADTAPPIQQEFGVEAVAAPAPTPSGAGGGSPSGGGGGGSASTVRQEFAP